MSPRHIWDGSTLDPFLREVGDGMVGSGRFELALAVGSSPVVVAGVFVERGAKVAPAEDEHAISDLGADGECESFRVRVRAGAARRDLHDRDAGAGGDGVERIGVLPGPVPHQDRELGCLVSADDGGTDAAAEPHQLALDPFVPPPPSFLGRSRTRAVRIARSAQVKRGRVPRRSTATSWRSTSSSTSLDAEERPSNRKEPAE